MSDDIQDDSPMLIGEPLEADEMVELLTIDLDDMESAMDWWDVVASPLFVGVLEV